MKTINLNFKMILLFVILLALSGLLVSGLVSPVRNMDIGAPVEPLGSKPEKQIQTLGAGVNMGKKTSEEIPATPVEVVSSQVKDFVPEFDEEWCKAHYPQHEGKNISLKSEDMVIMDKNGSKITDYNTLSLKLAPVSAGQTETAVEQFEDAYVDVKGIGPMKIKAVRFNFESGK